GLKLDCVNFYESAQLAWVRSSLMDYVIEHWKLSLLWAAAYGTACVGMFKSNEIAGPLGYASGAAAGVISIIAFGMFTMEFYNGVKALESPSNLLSDKRV
ncbi:hypothetical protein V1517DRAFT_342104, partial [Lipomyces orientalis]